MQDCMCYTVNHLKLVPIYFLMYKTMVRVAVCLHGCLEETIVPSSTDDFHYMVKLICTCMHACKNVRSCPLLGAQTC